MGAKASLEPFAPEDGFLRRIVYANHIKRGYVHWRAFKDAHPTLSFTYRDDELATCAGLDLYQIRKALPSGDLPGICMLTFLDLTCSLEPPLEPRQEVDNEDEYYGELHCVTDQPVDKAQRQEMAKLAAKRQDVLRSVVPLDERVDRG